jgi:hypothetical protein
MSRYPSLTSRFFNTDLPAQIYSMFAALAFNASVTIVFTVQRSLVLYVSSGLKYARIHVYRPEAVFAKAAASPAFAEY